MPIYYIHSVRPRGDQEITDIPDIQNLEDTAEMDPTADEGDQYENLFEDSDLADHHGELLILLKPGSLISMRRLIFIIFQEDDIT